MLPGVSCLAWQALSPFCVCKGNTILCFCKTLWQLFVKTLHKISFCFPLCVVLHPDGTCVAVCFLILLACKRCRSDLAEESRRAECGLGVLFLCIGRLDRCLLRRFRGCGQVEQMHLWSILVCMVQQGKFLGGRCGGGHAWRDVCQTQCAALSDAPCCDGWCSALRSPMHRAAMILRNPFASLLLRLTRQTWGRDSTNQKKSYTFAP